MKHFPAPAILAAALALGGRAVAQEDAWTLHVTPTSLELKVGETAQLEVLVLDASGRPQELPIVFFSRSRGAVRVDKTGKVKARRPGSFTMVVRTARRSEQRLSTEVPVTVAYAEIASLEFVDPPDKLYVGVSTLLEIRVVDEVGLEREDVSLTIVSTDEAVASIDAPGYLTARGPGLCTIEASVGSMVERLELPVEANPVREIELEADGTRVRTGDVVRFQARALDADGAAVPDAPIAFSFSVRPDDDLGQAATGQIEPDGRFVAQRPGMYTIYAGCGDVTSHLTIRAEARGVERRIKLIGRGAVHDVHTSDLWVWEGVDGRDYAVTGTWGANGEARFWDVTDPANIELISTVTCPRAQ